MAPQAKQPAQGSTDKEKQDALYGALVKGIAKLCLSDARERANLNSSPPKALPTPDFSSRRRVVSPGERRRCWGPAA